MGETGTATGSGSGTASGAPVTLLSVIDCGLIIKRLLLNWIPYAKPHHG